MPTKPAPTDPIRRARDRAGRRAEWIAAAWLMLRGHRILARRHKTPFGEIDLIARRGHSLLFVEVKYRATIDEAQVALTAYQADRIARAATHYISRHPGLSALDQNFDAILVAPRTRPHHVRGAMTPVGTSGRRY